MPFFDSESRMRATTTPSGLTIDEIVVCRVTPPNVTLSFEMELLGLA